MSLATFGRFLRRPFRPFKEFYDNGQLKLKGSWRDGKLDGLCEKFDENGQLQFRGNYIDGKQDGLTESYHDNGQLKVKGNFKDGKRDGHTESYHDNGQLQFRGNYIDGKRDGLTESYHNNGQLRRKGNYIEGKEDGLLEEFYKNGQLKTKTNFTDGKEDGLRKETQSKNKQQQERERFVDAERIINKYGVVIENLNWMENIYDSKNLPYSKRVIADALIAMYKAQPDANSRQTLKSGLLTLSFFQEGVGDKPVWMLDAEFAALNEKASEEYKRSLKLLE